MSRIKFDWATALGQEVPSAVAHNTGVTVTCPCGETGEVHYSSRRLPPEIIRKQFIRKGWRIMRRACVCPTCQTKEPTTMVSMTVDQENRMRAANEQKAANDSPVPIPSEKQTPDARKVHRQVMGWLEEAYEEEARRYKKGFSDQSIAEETGAALSYVVKCREDYFGALSAPPEIETLLQASSALHKEINAANDKLDQFMSEHAGRLDGLRSKVKVVERALGDLKQENGWK